MDRDRDLSPREAAKRWLDKRRPDLREATLSSLWYRLKLFVEWCEDRDVGTMAELDGWTVDEYEIARRGEGAKTLTLEKELGTLKQWLEYCHNIGLVDETVPAAVDPPTASTAERSDDTKLAPADGEALLAYFRDGPERASRAHAIFEILWTVGCRAGGLVALDVQDFDPETQVLEFHHRPETGTGLKNDIDGERHVGLLDATSAVLNEWLDQRPPREDEFGRQPLFPSREGRPNPGTVRSWMYLATVPCHRTDCPHGRDPNTCEWLSYSTASQCPSSRAPHHIRTGSITWQRSRGLPVEVVAKRVNSAPSTIRNHYDKEDPRRELEERRRAHLENLELDDDGT